MPTQPQDLIIYALAMLALGYCIYRLRRSAKERGKCGRGCNCPKPR